MAITTKRIINLDTAASVANDDYIVLDGTTNGTRKLLTNGKGLSTNDYTDAEKAKVASIDDIQAVLNALKCYDTASGSIASFTDGANYPLKSCTAEINAVQSGSGTPSPNNVRAISGFGAVNIVVSPTTSAGDGTTTTITLPSTIYGGSLEAVSGAVTVTHNYIDLGTVTTWSRTGTGTSGKYRFVCYISGAKPTQSDTTNGVTSMCNQMTELASGGTYSANADGYTIAANGDIYVYIDDYKAYSVADFKTAMSGVYLCYTLATPTSTTATATEITALGSTNNIWADSGDVSVEYLVNIGLRL